MLLLGVLPGVIDVFLEVHHFPIFQVQNFRGYFRLITDGVLSIFDLLDSIKLFGSFSLLSLLILTSVLELVITSIFVTYNLGGTVSSESENVTFDSDTGEVLKHTKTRHNTTTPGRWRVGGRR